MGGSPGPGMGPSYGLVVMQSKASRRLQQVGAAAVRARGAAVRAAAGQPVAGRSAAGDSAPPVAGRCAAGDSGPPAWGAPASSIPQPSSQRRIPLFGPRAPFGPGRQVAKLMAEGKLKPLIDRVVPLEQASGARQAPRGHAGGARAGERPGGSPCRGGAGGRRAPRYGAAHCFRSSPAPAPCLALQVAEAHAHQESGHARGKVVLKVADLQ
jgi:hypothetical protein